MVNKTNNPILWYDEVEVKVIPFSDLATFDKQGKKIPFNSGDDKFEETLRTHLEIEIIINSLPTKVKEIFQLKRDGYSFTEIAGILKQDKRTVEQSFYRNCKKLRKKYVQKATDKTKR